MENKLFKKTDPETPSRSSGKRIPAGKYERLTVSLDEATSKILEALVRRIRDETDYKISKSEFVGELIKLIPAFEINPFYLGSAEDIKTQFETIRKKLESSKILINE